MYLVLDLMGGIDCPLLNFIHFYQAAVYNVIVDSIDWLQLLVQ